MRNASTESGPIDDGKDEIIQHVDAVAVKVEGLKPRGKRRSRYGGALREVCLAYWNAAQNNAEIRYSINTRITYKTVFEYFAKELSEHGVTSARQFRQALHSAHNLEYIERHKKLDEQRDGRKKPLPAHGSLDTVKGHAGKTKRSPVRN